MADIPVADLSSNPLPAAPSKRLFWRKRFFYPVRSNPIKRFVDEPVGEGNTPTSTTTTPRRGSAAQAVEADQLPLVEKIARFFKRVVSRMLGMDGGASPLSDAQPPFSNEYAGRGGINAGAAGMDGALVHVTGDGTSRGAVLRKTCNGGYELRFVDQPSAPPVNAATLGSPGATPSVAEQDGLTPAIFGCPAMQRALQQRSCYKKESSYGGATTSPERCSSTSTAPTTVVAPPTAAPACAPPRPEPDLRKAPPSCSEAASSPFAGGGKPLRQTMSFACGRSAPSSPSRTVSFPTSTPGSPAPRRAATAGIESPPSPKYLTPTRMNALTDAVYGEPS